MANTDEDTLSLVEGQEVEMVFCDEDPAAALEIERSLNLELQRHFSALETALNTVGYKYDKRKPGTRSEQIATFFVENARFIKLGRDFDIILKAKNENMFLDSLYDQLVVGLKLTEE